MSRTARRLLSALEAMLRVLRGGVQFVPVYGLMAGDANSDSIVNVNDSFGMFGDRFNVVSVELSAVPALLTPEAVPLENRLAPLCKVTFGKGSFSMQAMASLPCTCLFANTGIGGARARAEFSRFVAARKRLTAPCTRFFNGGISMRPAGATAIMGILGAICGHQFSVLKKEKS